MVDRGQEHSATLLYFILATSNTGRLKGYEKQMLQPLEFRAIAPIEIEKISNPIVRILDILTIYSHILFKTCGSLDPHTPSVALYGLREKVYLSPSPRSKDGFVFCHCGPLLAADEGTAFVAKKHVRIVSLTGPS